MNCPKCGDDTGGEMIRVPDWYHYVCDWCDCEWQGSPYSGEYTIIGEEEDYE